MSQPLRIAMILSDEREVFRAYSQPTPFFGTAPTALLDGLAETPGCEAHIVSCLQQPVQSPPSLAPNIYFHSVVVRKWGWLRAGYAPVLSALRRKLRQVNPDLVHGQGTERYCALAAAFSGAPNIITLHGNLRRVTMISKARPFSFDWAQARLESFTLPRVGGVICLSSHTRKEVEAVARQTWIVPNAVDASFFGVANSPSPEKIILCVANILTIKNQNALIRALDPIAASIPFKLVFLGNANPADPYAREFANLLKSRPWCQHVGFADRALLKSWLQSASALVLPSLEENCPMAVLEAMAAGVPVLAARVGGVPDLIEDRVTGLLCSPNDPADIGGKISMILDQPALGQRLAIRAKEIARKRFHPLVIAARHLEIYQELLGKFERKRPSRA